MFDYYHNNLVESDDDDNSDFDIRNLSDVSDDDTSISKETPTLNKFPPISPPRQHSPGNTVIENEDEDMTDAGQDTATSPFLEEEEKTTLEQYDNDVNSTQQDPNPRPSWGSDDNDEQRIKYQSPTSENTLTWTTTPSRSPKKLSTSPASDKSNARQRQTRAAQHLYQKAFPFSSTANRFSPLTEEHKCTPNDISRTSLVNESLDALDTSNIDSDYADNDSFDDASFDGMSLVSNSELNDLEDDLRGFDDDGYDTETTDNTSPSNKLSQTTRKSSSNARARIRDHFQQQESMFYNATTQAAPTSSSSRSQSPETQDSPQSPPPTPVAPFPHLSPNTNSTREGSGAAAT